MINESFDCILFLDIDGVMIPATQLLVNPNSGWDRIFPATTIAVLNEICKITKAKVVFNTTHNQKAKDVPDIEIALVNHGFKAEYIHPTDYKTLYPTFTRAEAIQEWLLRHPEVGDKWVALDDVICAEYTHMVQVSTSGGLNVDNANHVINILGGQMIIMLM